MTRTVRLAQAIICGSLAAVAGCGEAPAPSHARPVPAPPQRAWHAWQAAGGLLDRTQLEDLDPDADPAERCRHILLITLDTLRADHLSCYGYVLPTTPFLDSFAARGARFTRAFAPCSTTGPSHASMLTGLYPLQHRVQKNGHRLADDVATLPEILSAAGFQTAAFVSVPRLFSGGNLHQGFGHFDEPTSRETLIDQPGRREPYNLRYRPAPRTLDRALQWLRQADPARPTFLWIHLFDPHRPYAQRPGPMAATMPDDAAGVGRWIDQLVTVHRFSLPVETSGPVDWPEACNSGIDVACVALYDAEVRHLDASLGSFFEAAAPCGIDGFLTVIAADHGEGLGTHGWWEHSKHIFNEQLRVPLLLRWPDGAHAGATIDQIVELNDLMPTILLAAGVAPELLSTMRRLPIEGTPLQPLLRGDPSAAGRFGRAFAQRRVYPPDAVDRWKFEPGLRYALLDERWKYMWWSAGDDELYDLRDDFYEQRNLLAEAPQTAARLKAAMRDLIDALSAASSLQEQLADEQTIRAIEALGYMR